MELFLPDYQDIHYDCDHLVRNNEKHGPNGESTIELYERTQKYILEVTENFKAKTIITVAHAESILMMTKRIRDFNFDVKRPELKLDNAEVRTFYRDNERNTEVDLHKPYIDNYWFKK